MLYQKFFVSFFLKMYEFSVTSNIFGWYWLW